MYHRPESRTQLRPRSVLVQRPVRSRRGCGGTWAERVVSSVMFSQRASEPAGSGAGEGLPASSKGAIPSFPLICCDQVTMVAIPELPIICRHVTNIPHMVRDYWREAIKSSLL